MKNPKHYFFILFLVCVGLTILAVPVFAVENTSVLPHFLLSIFGF